MESSFIFGAQGTTVAPRFTSVASNEPLISIDDCYLGINTNIGTVQQAYLYGTAEQAGGANCKWSQNTSTSESNYVDIGTAASCATAWTATGGVATIGTTDHRITLNNAPPGSYEVQLNAAFVSGTTAQNCNFQFSDGTNSFGYIIAANSNGSGVNGGTMIGTVTYSTAGTRTFKVQSSDSGAGACDVDAATAGRKISWRVYYSPSSAQQAVRESQPQLPTYQRITASGTYTRPAGVTHIRIHTLGGGGGGGCASSSSCSGGSAGSATTVVSGSTTLISAGGGGTGVLNGDGLGANGTCTFDSSVIQIVNMAGNQGGGVTTGAAGLGGFGGVGFFGGGVSEDGGSNSGGARAGAANSGSGGSGAASTGVSFAGSGGGAGAYCFGQVNNPPSSLTITIGGGGSGLSGTIPGGNGGSGIVIVEEFYGTAMPVIANSVTSSSSGAERIERARVSTGAACTTSPCTIDSTPGITSITRNSQGNYNVNFTAGTFSVAPVCVAVAQSTGALKIATVASVSTSLANVQVVGSAFTVQDDGFHIICMGPR